MAPEEVHLKCLEFAMATARAENKAADLEHIARVESRFYTIVTGGKTSVPEAEQKEGRRGAAKLAKVDPLS